MSTRTTFGRITDTLRTTEYSSWCRHGEYRYGKGITHILRNDPKEYVLQAGGDEQYIQVVKNQCEQKSADNLIFKNPFYLGRVPYDIAAVKEEVPARTTHACTVAL